jgi:PAS domain S-box-containing protein
MNFNAKTKRRRRKTNEQGHAEDQAAPDAMQQQLQESEEGFQTMFAHVPVGMAHVALDGRWLRVNQHLCQIVGYAREELLASTLQAITHPDDLTPAMKYVQQVLAGARQSYRMEHRFVRKDGALTWVSLAVSLVRDTTGQPLYSIAVIEDINQRKQVEAEHARLLREQEARAQAEASNLRLQAIQSLTDTALAHLALDDLLREVQERIVAFLGVDNSAILLLSEDSTHLTIRASHGPEEEVAPQVRVPFGRGIAGRIAARRQPLIVDDLSHEEVANNFLKEKMRSLVGVPLLVNDRVIGVLHVDTATPHHFTQEDVQLLELVAQRVALAIDHARLYEAEQRARAEAVEHASQLEAILEAIPNMVTLYDAQGTMIRLNEAARRGILPGQGYEQLRDVPSIYQLRTLSGEPVAVDQLPITQALQGNVVTDARFRQDRSDGPFYTSSSAAPFYTAQGEIAGAVAITHDITPLLQAQHQAAESAKRLEVVFESLADALALVDARGNLVQANQAYSHLVKLDRRPDYLHLPLAERLRLVEMRSISGEPLALDRSPVARVLRGEVLNHDHAADVLIRALDGHEIETSVSGAPLRNEQGEITGGVLVIRDVTERRRLMRRTYEALDALLEMAQALVEGPGEAALDKGRPPEETGKMARRLAELACRVLGCSRISMSIIEPETEVVRPVTVVGLSPQQERQWWAEQPQNIRLSDSLEQAAVEQLRAGKHVIYDLRQPPYNQRPNPYNITTMLVLPMLVGKQLIGLITVDHAGSEHSSTDQELNLAQAVARLIALVIERDRLLRQREEARANELALRASNRQMSDFLGIASHELLTPLTSIKAYLQLAERRMRPLVAPEAFPDGIQPQEIAAGLHPFHEMLGRLAGQVERVNRLVSDLLDVSRIQAGRLALQFVPCDLKDVVREAVEEQRLSWVGREISLTLPDSQVGIQSDPARLGQVVTNYLTNALKYSPPPSPVAVSLRLEDGQARVEVRDEGPGLPPEEQEHIWERFHRAQGVEVQSGTGIGLGLGLHICKTIIERHQGQVGVQSTPGRGATFWFTLPLAAE